MSVELGPELTPILPLSPNHVVGSLENLANSSGNMINLIIAARDSNPGQHFPDFYSALPVKELEAWHVNRGDFLEEGGKAYRAGLIYGTDMTLSAARDTDLKPDAEPDLWLPEVAQATDYLFSSYNGNPHTDSAQWKLERFREISFTGSDILSLASAGLYNVLRERLTRDGIDLQSNQTAQHTGILDGVIAVDAFRKIINGVEPKPELVEKEEPSSINPDRMPAFGELKDIKQVIELIKVSRPEYFESSVAERAKLLSRSRTKQVGPNAFMRYLEDEAVVAPKYWSKLMGVFAVSGATIDTTNYLLKHMEKTVNTLDYAPVSTAVSLLIYSGLYGIRRKMAKKEADFRGVKFLSRSEFRKNFK